MADKRKGKKRLKRDDVGGIMNHMDFDFDAAYSSLRESADQESASELLCDAINEHETLLRFHGRTGLVDIQRQTGLQREFGFFLPPAFAQLFILAGGLFQVLLMAFAARARVFELLPAPLPQSMRLRLVDVNLSPRLLPTPIAHAYA